MVLIARKSLHIGEVCWYKEYLWRRSTGMHIFVIPNGNMFISSSNRWALISTAHAAFTVWCFGTLSCGVVDRQGGREYFGCRWIFTRWKCAEGEKRMRINRCNREAVDQRSIYLPADGNSIGLFQRPGVSTKNVIEGSASGEDGQVANSMLFQAHDDHVAGIAEWDCTGGYRLINLDLKFKMRCLTTCVDTGFINLKLNSWFFYSKTMSVSNNWTNGPLQTARQANVFVLFRLLKIKYW